MAWVEEFLYTSFLFLSTIVQEFPQCPIILEENYLVRSFHTTKTIKIRTPHICKWKRFHLLFPIGPGTKQLPS